MIPVQKNDEHVVEIVDLTHEGSGVARIDGYTVFIPGALPTEQVKIKITKTTKSYGFGRIRSTRRWVWKIHGVTATRHKYQSRSNQTN